MSLDHQPNNVPQQLASEEHHDYGKPLVPLGASLPRFSVDQAALTYARFLIPCSELIAPSEDQLQTVTKLLDAFGVESFVPHATRQIAETLLESLVTEERISTDSLPSVERPIQIEWNSGFHSEVLANGELNGARYHFIEISLSDLQGDTDSEFGGFFGGPKLKIEFSPQENEICCSIEGVEGVEGVSEASDWELLDRCLAVFDESLSSIINQGERQGLTGESIVRFAKGQICVDANWPDLVWPDQPDALDFEQFTDLPETNSSGNANCTVEVKFELGSDAQLAEADKGQPHAIDLFRPPPEVVQSICEELGLSKMGVFIADVQNEMAKSLGLTEGLFKNFSTYFLGQCTRTDSIDLNGSEDSKIDTRVVLDLEHSPVGEIHIELFGRGEISIICCPFISEDLKEKGEARARPNLPSIKEQAERAALINWKRIKELAGEYRAPEIAEDFDDPEDPDTEW